MSLGSNALIATKIDMLTKTNSRLERSVLKVNTQHDNVDLRHRLHKDREAAMKLCTELARTFHSNDKNSMTVSYSQKFARELKRFEALSKDLVSKDQQFLEPVYFQEEGGASSHASSYEAQHKQMLLDSTKLLSQEEMEQIDIQQMQQREREVLQVEQDVGQIHEMFSDLKALVIEQGEQLDSIEENITTTHSEVSSGLENIQEAEEFQKKARNRKCLLMLIIVIVITLLVLGFLKAFL